MPYKRRYNIDRPTTVQIHWSIKSGAYAIKFLDTYHWNEMQIFISYMKNIIYGERDYDPDNKVWYLHEKHLSGFKTMMEMLPDKFIIDFQEKPIGGFQGQFISVDVYIDKFNKLSGLEDIRTLEYDKAKKIYRRLCLQYHPDRNNGDGSKMSEINEIWAEIEKLHYKIKKEPEYAF